MKGKKNFSMKNKKNMVIHVQMYVYFFIFLKKNNQSSNSEWERDLLADKILSAIAIRSFKSGLSATSLAFFLSKKCCINNLSPSCKCCSLVRGAILSNIALVTSSGKSNRTLCIRCFRNRSMWTSNVPNSTTFCKGKKKYILLQISMILQYTIYRLFVHSTSWCACFQNILFTITRLQ